MCDDVSLNKTANTAGIYESFLTFSAMLACDKEGHSYKRTSHCTFKSLPAGKTTQLFLSHGSKKKERERRERMILRWHGIASHNEAIKRR
jgi:hypothetical protein